MFVWRVTYERENVMARVLPSKTDEVVSRKVAVRDGEVHLLNHAVKTAADSPEQTVFDRVILVYPGCEDTPPWLLEKAARADWITVQRHLRTLSQAERESFEGRRLDVTQLDELLGLRVKREPLKDRLAALREGRLSQADFEATLTKAEAEQWEAAKAFLQGDAQPATT